MQDIRVNDLARELEVKSRRILEALTASGINRGKTHSSSLTRDEANTVRAFILKGMGLPPGASQPRQLGSNLLSSKIPNSVQNSEKTAQRSNPSKNRSTANFVVNPDRIVQVFGPLVDVLPISVIQDCLADAGLIPRTRDREALKDACPDREQFWKILNPTIRSRGGYDPSINSAQCG